MSKSPYRRGGGRYAETTFEANGKTIHIITGEVDSDGEPVMREVSAAEDIRAALPDAYIQFMPKRPRD